MPAPDNPRSDPTRLFGVAEPEAWESEVRGCLADRAAGPAPLPRNDLAGTAIARGRQRQRRRQLAGLVAVVGATVLATGALMQGLPGGGGGQPGPASGVIGDPAIERSGDPDEPTTLAGDPALAVTLAVDLVGAADAGEGPVLATGDGRMLDLSAIGEVVSAHRVGEGWAVVSGGSGTARLWWVRARQPPKPVLAGMDQIVVDQARVAWRRGAVLAAAQLSGDGELRNRSTTAAPDGDGRPAGFLGETVLLAGSDPGGWDTWHPGGDYQPGWNAQVVRVYGELPDGESAIGLVRPEPDADQPCLARLDLQRKLAPTEVRCQAGELSADAPAALSPEGDWLITVGGAGGGAGTGPVLVDVAEALADRPAVTPVRSLSSLAGPPVWADPARALVRSGDRLVRVDSERLHTGAPNAVEKFDRSQGVLVVVQTG